MDRLPGLYLDRVTLGWIVAGGGASALFFFTSIFVPLIGSFLGILSPIPLMVLCLRKGWSAGGLASLVAAFLIGISLKPEVALYFMVQFALLGLVASLLIAKRMSFGLIMLAASLTVAAGFFLLVGFQAASTHQGIFETLKKPLQNNIQAVLNSYRGLYGPGARETSSMFQKMLSYLVALFPALIIIGSWVILLFDLYIMDRFRLVPGQGILRAYDLNFWRASDPLIWFVIVPGFVVFLLHGSLRMIGLNILIVALTVYFFQGLCIINYYFTKKKTPTFIKLLFYLVLFVMQFIAIMVVLLGLLDMWMNFRKIPQGPDITLPSGSEGSDKENGN